MLWGLGSDTKYVLKSPDVEESRLGIDSKRHQDWVWQRESLRAEITILLMPSSYLAMFIFRRKESK